MILLFRLLLFLPALQVFILYRPFSSAVGLTKAFFCCLGVPEDKAKLMGKGYKVNLVAMARSVVGWFWVILQIILGAVDCLRYL